MILFLWLLGVTNSFSKEDSSLDSKLIQKAEFEKDEKILSDIFNNHQNKIKILNALASNPNLPQGLALSIAKKAVAAGPEYVDLMGNFKSYRILLAENKSSSIDVLKTLSQVPIPHRGANIFLHKALAKNKNTPYLTLLFYKKYREFSSALAANEAMTSKDLESIFDSAENLPNVVNVPRPKLEGLRMVQALVRNPKTPQGVISKILSQIKEKKVWWIEDLKLLNKVNLDIELSSLEKEIKKRKS